MGFHPNKKNKKWVRVKSTSSVIREPQININIELHKGNETQMQEQLKKKKRKERVKYTLSRKRGSKSLERAPFTLPSNSLRILTCLSLEAGVRVRGRHGFEFQGRNRVDDDGQERVLGFRF